MKKLLSLGLLALALVLLSERQADAWVNAKFSVGLNWQIQSGNNTFLWGLYRNGQVPGPEAYGGGYGYGGPGFAPPGLVAPGMAQPSNQAFPYFGAMPPASTGGESPPQPTSQPQNSQQTSAGYYGYNPYSTVSYQHGYTPGYTPNYYGYPSYYGTGYDAPFYWYNSR